jgi:hypothetical protein
MTIEEIVLKAKAGTLDITTLTPYEKALYDLYAAQGGFRGTGLATQ